MIAEQGFLENLLNGLDEEIEIYLAKYGGEHSSTKSLIGYRSKIAALDGAYPDDAEELKGVDVKYKARILKSELRSIFPDQKFSVRISRFAGGSSIHVEWEDRPMLPEDEEQYRLTIAKYSFEYPDSNPQIDYCHVDNFAHGQGPRHQPPKKK